VGNSEQVGIFPNQGAAHQHSKTGRGQKERRNQETSKRWLCGGSTGQHMCNTLLAMEHGKKKQQE